MVEGKRMEEEAAAAAAEEEKKEKLKLRRLQVRGSFVVVCIAFDAVCFLCGWNGMMMMITPITMLLVSLSSSSFAHYHHLARMPSCHSPCNSHTHRGFVLQVCRTRNTHTHPRTRSDSRPISGRWFSPPRPQPSSPHSSPLSQSP